jgi:PAS domain S-box-containing protein
LQSVARIFPPILSCENAHFTISMSARLDAPAIRICALLPSGHTQHPVGALNKRRASVCLRKEVLEKGHIVAQIVTTGVALEENGLGRERLPMPAVIQTSGAQLGKERRLFGAQIIDQIKTAQAANELKSGEFKSSALLQALPAAVYTTDAVGRITFYNEAAAALWGCRPELGKSEWCGSWCLYWPDGRPMPHGECPMAIALKEKRGIRGAEAVAERPDGTRIPFLAYPTPLWDETGALAGAVNTLVDITERKKAEEAAQRLAAIVETSDDAIVSKDLKGIIKTWNAGAQRLFGYSAAEVIGKPITILIPPDNIDEEPAILERIHRGERIEHYETVRQRKESGRDFAERLAHQKWAGQGHGRRKHCP